MLARKHWHFLLVKPVGLESQISNGTLANEMTRSVAASRAESG